MPARISTILMAAMLLFCSCNAFMHGYTWSKAENAYLLVTGDPKNLGDKRVRYLKKFHRSSALSKCITEKGNPSFIYEYMTADKRRGARFFYMKLDSVFIYEEPRRNNLSSILREARHPDNYERETYQRLLTGK